MRSSRMSDLNDGLVDITHYCYGYGKVKLIRYSKRNDERPL